MNVHLILTVAVIGMVTVNAIATAVKNALDRVAAQSRADKIAGKVAKYSSTVLGFLTANTQMLPQDIAKELPAPAAQVPGGAPGQNPGA